MRRGVLIALLAATLTACGRDVVGPDVPISVALDFLPFPSVVVGDTLRDTTGATAPVRARAFNYLGEEVEGVPFTYFILDRGARIDTLTGMVRGDSLRDTPVRVVARFGTLQTQTQPLAIVQRPDSLHADRQVDTLRYSVTDTVQNVSQPLSVRLFDVAGAPVRAWVVTYDIVHASSPQLVTIVEGNRATRIDTTGTDGTASRQLRLHVEQLATQVDSVVLEASARYRGEHVRASPRRFVVHIQPRTP